MKADVLIIEDEQELAELVQLYLEQEGLNTSLAGSAEIGMDLLSKKSFNLIILDINLPGLDGFEFLQQLRTKSQIPVIIVSAREADEDIIMGLGSGADEFVTKPFAPKVLAARVRALLRRSMFFSTEKITSIRFGDFELDTAGYSLKQKEINVQIPAREFEILRLLVEHAGTVFSLHEIHSLIWGQEFGEVSAVSVYVQRIRKKIEEDYHFPEYIKTIHGKGYLFVREKLL